MMIKLPNFLAICKHNNMLYCGKDVENKRIELYSK